MEGWWRYAHKMLVVSLQICKSASHINNIPSRLEWTNLRASLDILSASSAPSFSVHTYILDTVLILYIVITDSSRAEQSLNLISCQCIATLRAGILEVTFCAAGFYVCSPQFRASHESFAKLHWPCRWSSNERYSQSSLCYLHSDSHLCRYSSSVSRTKPVAVLWAVGYDRVKYYLALVGIGF